MGGWFGWQNDVTIQGIAFSKARTEKKTGIVIGRLDTPTVIAGRPCKEGWVHLYQNGVPAGFTAAEDIKLERFTIPAETWVIQGEAGTVKVCAFPRDTEIQGHLCRGSGGPKGIHAAFYPSGALRQYYLRHDTRIHGVPCMSGLTNQSIELHENGRLKACRLSEDFTVDGRVYAKGKRIEFDPAGRIVP